MKKGLLLFVALAVCFTIASAVMPRDLKNVPNPKMSEPTSQPVRHYPAAKDQADSIIGDVHANSAYITTVRAIDYDPVADAAFVVYRTASGASLNYIGSTDRGANWTLITDLNSFTGVRYPSAMADLIDAKPWACYNTGIGVSALKGAYHTADAAGYNGGLWDPETRVDSLGAGSGTNGMYIATAHRGSNGTVHWLHNYWGVHTPDAAVYYRSTDGGANWSTQIPRSGNVLFYNLDGTSDSTNLFGAGNPVIHDSCSGGYTNQVALWGSETGDTMMIGSNGVDTFSAVNGTPVGTQRFWYRMSYDAGQTWGPFTWADDAGQLTWAGESYDLGIALDKHGYPHFAAFLFEDTTAAGNYGPNSGLIDYHLTAGGWVKTMVHQIDSLGNNNPRFANYGMDVDGNLYLSYADNLEGATTDMNIWLAYSADDGTTWTKKMVTTDGAGYDYPHLPRHIGGASSLIPVWYQRGSAGFVTWVTPMGVAGKPTVTVAPAKFALNRAYPNPARSFSTIAFSLPKAGAYSVKVYNIAGQLVQSIGGLGKVGSNSVTLNTKGLANGVFFYQLTSGGNTATQKLTVVR